MKTTLFIIISFLLFQSTNIFYGQSVTMSNTTVNQCFGNILDPGGNANYPNNSNITTTICPGIPGAFVRLNFTFFNTEEIFDNLTIYDGNTTAAPVLGSFSGILGPFIIQATNLTGCLTLVFTSDANFNSLGFNANINCALPCQPVIAQVTSSSPAFNVGFIDLCVGSILTVNGNGNYPSPAPVYPQSDANSTFRWNFGDLTVSTLQNASNQYNTPGVYDLDLIVTDINGCSSTNDVGLKVRVSDTVSFTGTVAASNSICLGETNDLSGFVTSTEIVYFCESSNSQDVVIPDGIGAPYSTTLNLDCFNPGATVTSAADINSICFDIEHSYLHDLEITLTCPNGTSISLYDPNATGIAPVNSVQLGEPVDDDLSATLGTPYSYCFNMGATDTWYDVAEGNAGPVPTHSYVDNDGTPIANTLYIPAGDYLPSQTFGNLVGCPLNGDWTITVVDQLASDNGAVFDISMDFNATLYSNANNYVPGVAGNWTPDPTISSTLGNTITVTPTTIGNKCYTYEATDEFGCVFDTTICFDVVPADDATFSFAKAIYCTNESNPTPVVSGTLGGTFTANNGLIINAATGTIDLTVAAPGAYDITYTTAGLTGCPASSTITVNVNTITIDFSATNRSGCAPLTSTFTNLSPNSVNCVWDFGDGSTANGCGSINHVYSISGSFSPQLTITDNNGCVASLTKPNLILVDEDPIASFVTNPESIPSTDQTVVLNNTSLGATNYTWLFEDNSISNATSPIINLTLEEGEEYLVKLYAYSAGGCVDSTLQYLRITPDLIFYIPNSFTPNADEYNTVFLPIMTQGLRRDSYNFRIYDRWGSLVFQSKDVNSGWDGTYSGSGRIAQDGVYSYQIDFLINNVDERKSYQGHVNLIR